MNSILNSNFQNGSFVADLIDLVEIEKKLSANNGKLLMYDIIDGKYPQDMSFKDIIDKDFAFDSEPIDYEQVVK